MRSMYTVSFLLLALACRGNSLVPNPVSLQDAYRLAIANATSYVPQPIQVDSLVRTWPQPTLDIRTPFEAVRSAPITGTVRGADSLSRTLGTTPVSGKPWPWDLRSDGPMFVRVLQVRPTPAGADLSLIIVLDDKGLYEATAYALTQRSGTWSCRKTWHIEI